MIRQSCALTDHIAATSTVAEDRLTQAAALAPVGTAAIVFKTCEAIW